MYLLLILHCFQCISIIIKGKVNSSIISQRSKHKPKNSFKGTQKADIYIDWVNTMTKQKIFKQKVYWHDISDESVRK